MLKPVIEVKNLSKVYKISHARKPYHTLREDLVEAAKTPLRFLRGHRTEKEEFWALKDVSFDVKQGEVLGIIGKNGAGKSTLLKILSRITNPTSGSAVLRGRVASLLEVGTGFHPELTGRENIYLNGALLGMSRQEITRKFDEIVAFAEVEKFLDTPVKFYSSGMYVRLAFAVAAHLEPEILIVDEVLAVGDAQFQKKSLEKMSEIARSGRTILFVSHNLGAIRQLCGRAVLMDAGRGVVFKSSAEAVAKYQTLGVTTSPKGKYISVGEKGLLFTDLHLNGVELAREPTVLSGDPLKFSFHYRSDKRNQDILIGLSIKSARDGSKLIFTHNQLESAKHLTGEKGNIFATLYVPKLAPGLYNVELTVLVDSNYYIQDLPIGSFRVAGVPSFRSKQTFDSFPSSLLVDSDWSFEAG